MSYQSLYGHRIVFKQEKKSKISGVLLIIDTTLLTQ